MEELRLRDLRAASGKSQKEIAREMGCTQQNVSLMEKGNRAEGLIRDYARACGYRVIYEKLEP